MADLVIGRYRRAGQDVSSRLIKLRVHVTTDAVPHGRHELPLIDQAWLLAIEQDHRRHAGSFGSGGDTELAQDVGDVHSGGTLADEQLLGDLAVRPARRDST